MVSDELVATYASVTGTDPGEAARILEVRTTTDGWTRLSDRFGLFWLKFDLIENVLTRCIDDEQRRDGCTDDTESRVGFLRVRSVGV